MVKTFYYTWDPDGDNRENESKLHQVLHVWKYILECALDMLATADQKDILKWWVLPKNKAADQWLFELLQNAKSVAKYSTV